MQIKFSVNYTYYPAASKNKRFCAKISTFLPTDPNVRCHILSCYEGIIGNYEVKLDAGEPEGNFTLKKICVVFHAETLEMLNNKVERAIENYKKQVLKNIEIMKKLKDEEIILNLPEPIRVSVKYNYYPRAPKRNLFYADVTAFLPKEQNTNRILPYYFGKIGNCEIDSYAGYNEENSRKVCTSFYARSLKAINNKVKKAIESYKQQVLTNIEIMKKIKENKEIIADFPDLPELR